MFVPCSVLFIGGLLVSEERRGTSETNYPGSIPVNCLSTAFPVLSEWKRWHPLHGFGGRVRARKDMYAWTFK